MTEEKKKRSWIRSKLPFLVLTLLVILGVVGYNYRTDIEMRIVHLKPQPVRQVELGKIGIQLQRFNTPEITSYDVDKILSFVIRDDRFYLALRSQDGDSTAVQAYERKEGSLFPLRSFGKKGTYTIPDKMVLSVNIAGNGDIVYVKKGLHTLRDGNDIISLKGNTTATRVAFLPSGEQAYLYGNDNFTLAEYHDGAFEKNKPAFLHNRAKPFAGGLTQVRITKDGTIFGGGRIKPNGLNMVEAFNSRGKALRSFGSPIQTDKDSIYNLIDMAVLDHYLVVIDGFTLKFWTREGQYLGTLNSSKVLGDNLNCAKLAPIDGNTLGILAFVRNAQTRLVEIRIFALTFPR